MNNIKNELDNVCGRYKVIASDALHFTDIIVVPVRGRDLYLVFDKNCNVLGIDNIKISNTDNSMINDYFTNKYKPNKVENGEDLMSRDFTSYSLRLIQNISNKTFFSAKYCIFNGELIVDKYLEELLSYFSFLGQEIKFYSQVNFWMQKMGYDVPDIPSYINSILDELDHYIESCINLNNIPLEYDFMSSIGQSNISINPNIISNLFNFYLGEKGYEIDYENNCLKRSDKSSGLNVSDISKKLINKIQ